MLRGLWKLTWIEIKIFMREPLGALGTIGFPVLIFIVIGRVAGRTLPPSSAASSSFVRVSLPVIASLLIAVSCVLSLVTIISIYREGGILKRLRATPLRPQTILGAHVLVKLALTAATPGAYCRSALSSPASFPPRALRSRWAPPSCTRCSSSRGSSCRLHPCRRCSGLSPACFR